MTFDELKEKAHALPLKPGVYIMQDAKNEVIYVGKAKALKNRVSQYFANLASHTEKTRAMVSQIDHFDVIVADSEFEALILENSFHTNKETVKWLLNDANLERLASAQADTIALYYGITEPVKKSGWAEENGGWRFYLGNTGDYVANDWYKDGDYWYWFDAAGMMVHNDWKTGSDGKWYYLQENGAMAKDQWVIWKHELYRLKEDGSMFEGCVCLETDEKGALKFPDMGTLTECGKIEE